MCMKPFNPKKLMRDEKIAKAYELALSSYSLSEIGYKLGVCKTTAYNYLNEAKEKYEKFQEANLSYTRSMRIAQVEKLIRSRLKDLEESFQISRDAEAAAGFDDEESDADSTKSFQARARSFIIADLLRLYQELSRLQGLYEFERVEKFIVKAEVDSSYDVSNLSLEEMQNLFNEAQKKK